MTVIPQVPENIAKKKVIVYKSKVDTAVLKQKTEEMKNELFVKRFSKLKPEDIHVVSVDKHYEPYVLVDAKYRIEYYTKKVYIIDVAEKSKKVKILGESFKPQLVSIPNTKPEQFHNVIRLEGQEWSFYEAKTYFILDKNGNEISPDQVPIAPSEDNPKKLLKEFGKKAEKVTVSTRKVILMAKTKIIKKPSGVDYVDNEIFQVIEHAIIYNPIYIITLMNVKTKEEKAVRIDGVTAEVIQ